MPEKGINGAISRAMAATGVPETGAASPTRDGLDRAFLLAATDRGMPATADEAPVPPGMEAGDQQALSVDTMSPEQLALLRQAVSNSAIAAKLGISQQEARALLEEVSLRARLKSGGLSRSINQAMDGIAGDFGDGS
jgi:hypothetical protein